MFAVAPRVVVYPFGGVPPKVGEGWVALPVMPEWAPRLVPHGRVFGDGSHPTTRLCAAAVDLLCRQQPGMWVLDVGTGTGILARIARARGAPFVAGTDIDPVAIDCARAHAEWDAVCDLRTSGGASDTPGIASKNAGAAEPAAVGYLGAAGAAGVACLGAADAAGVACIGAGGAIGVAGLAAAGATADPTGVGTPARGIYFGRESPDHWGPCFHLVVANILEAPLHNLAPALRGALRPAGVLFISGFTRPQAPALRLRYETAGLQSIGEFCLDEWALLKFSAPEARRSHHNFSK